MFAYTLDRSTNGPLGTDPRLPRFGNTHDLVLGGPRTKLPANFIPGTNQFIDVQAPGIREQVPDPSRPYFGPYRSQLYQHNATNINNAPMLNWGDMPEGSNFLSNKWNQRYSNAMFEELSRTQDEYHWLWQDRGQFIVPYTGFSPLKDLRARSTLGDML